MKRKKEQPVEPLLISVQEAADMIGFSKRWLQIRIGTGEVPAVRTGASVRMRKSDVNTFVNTGAWPLTKAHTDYVVSHGGELPPGMSIEEFINRGGAMLGVNTSGHKKIKRNPKETP